MSDLPSALRAGGNPSRPPPRRTSTGGSRLSDLLGSRRFSTVSALDDDDDANEPPSRYGRKESLISPVSPRDVSPPEIEISVPAFAPFNPARPSATYTVPALPALPSLAEHEPLTSPFEPTGREHEITQSRGRGILGKIGTVRNGKLSRRQYEQLEDVDEENYGVDISGFDGPDIEMGSFSAQPALVLGGGMGHVLNARVAGGHKRGTSIADEGVRLAMQKEAQKTGEILAVEEVIGADVSGVDLGSLVGDHVTSRSGTMLSSTTLDTGEAKKSYFFPDDPHKPSWRPISMRWPYITLLIIIAILLAGAQEFLCQWSLQRQKNGGGLISFNNPKEIPTWAYFAWKYMPTMILVTYGVMWQIVDFEVKRLEPYYQLSRVEGATARNSLNLDYLTFMSYLIPVLAVKYRQWAVVWSSVAALLAGGLLPVLQSASINMYPKKPMNDEMKYVRVDPVWSRLLTASSGLVAVFGICLAISLRRKSGLLSDPKGIAGIAAMATKSHILADFDGLDTETNEVIHEKLKRRKYNLHKSSFWQGEYIRHADKIKEFKRKDNPVVRALSKVPGVRYLLRFLPFGLAPRKDGSKDEENPHPIMLRLGPGFLFILYLVLFGFTIPVLIFVPKAHIVTDKIPFFLTLLATVVKLLWQTLDMSIRVVEPYYVLSRRHAPARTLTLDYTGTIPGYLTIKALLNGHFLVAIVGLGAVLAEVLTVLVTSFNVNGTKFISGKGGDGRYDSDRENTSETFKSFWISFGLSIFILIYLSVVAALVYLRRRHIFLPRQPGSIAGVLAYIHQSRMLDSFVDTEKMDSRAMTRHLEKQGKRYGLGWFNGRDGQDHCGVDQEPLLSIYKHGEDWKKARMAGGDVGNWQLF